MLCKNLVSWAGPNFAHDAGQEVELSDDIAVARTAAGLASPIIEDDKERAAFMRRVEAFKRTAVATLAAAA